MLDQVRVTVWEGAHDVHDLFVEAHLAVGEADLKNGHAAEARLPEQQAGVQRPRAAESDQSVLAGVDAPLDRHPAQRRGHLRDRHLHDAVRGVLCGQAELTGGLRHRPARRAGSEGKPASQRRVRRQRARYNVRVGDGGPVTTPPERGRAGRRAGALRADP